MMRYILFSCKKCGSKYALEKSDDMFSSLCKLSVTDCQFCGEGGFEHWSLLGNVHLDQKKIKPLKPKEES